jgi:DNA-binding NtrC family response regulator
MAHILIVEDEAGYQAILHEVLSAAGHTTASAYSGAQALAMAQESRFDLFMIDNRMPGSSGLDFLKTRREGSDQTAAVVMTAYADVPVVVEAIRQGAAEFLVKPFRLDEVLPVVNRGLARTASV